jgi:hypothetical protein
MDYYVRHVFDTWDGTESWTLIDMECMPKIPDGRFCEVRDIYATAGSRPELELKMAALGVEIGELIGCEWLTATQRWTTWSVRRAHDR